MEIIQNFGIDPVLLAAQIVNFLIILYILKRFAYKPILDLLKNRQRTIKTGLQQADEARELLEKATEKEKDILKKAQLEAKKLLDDTKKQRLEMQTQTEQMTKREAERILKEAQEQIVFETQQAEKRLSAHISQLAVQFLERSVADIFSEEDQERIMKNALRRMKEKAN